jgi:hypothetical protein
MFDKVMSFLTIVLVFVLGAMVAIVWENYSGGRGVTGYSIDMPTDFVDEKEILVYEDRVILMIDNAKVSNYDNTGSMAPILGDGVNGITVKPKTSDEINEGDVITYYNGVDLIVHRVIEKGEDKEGVYFVTKGDNNDLSDGKVRFREIEGVLVGVIY